jgi:hypothetical protein
MRELRKLSDLGGFTLRAQDADIGKIREVFFDDQAWVVRYFVVRTGGWLLGREVLVAPRSVTGVDPEAPGLEVDLTREQVEQSPPVDTEKPVSRHYEEEFYRYYGWEGYWISGTLMPDASTLPPVPPRQTRAEGGPEHPHLRSSEELRGYHIRAADGEIGHVADFVLDDRDWRVRYLVVDTRNWLPGKQVLIAPAWVRSVDWGRRLVAVEPARDVIEEAPAYHPSRLITPEYEVRLYAHYGKRLEEGGD